MHNPTNSEIAQGLITHGISENKIKELGENIFDLIRLIMFVDIDDEYAISAKCGIWTMKLGFLDHWFSIYKNETPIADCYRGVVTTVNGVFNDIEEKVVKKILDEKINKLKA